MHRLTKATAIPKKVKDKVWERDGGKCVVCGYYPANPSCHIIARSHQGRGIETNIVSLCNDCHRLYDNSSREVHDRIDAIVVKYMKSIYGEEWSKEEQVYDKYKL